VQGYATAASLSTNAKGSVKAGKPVQLVAAVSGAGAVPTGTVALDDGADQVATGVLSGARSPSAGRRGPTSAPVSVRVT
jgi:hypothetical protein